MHRYTRLVPKWTPATLLKNDACKDNACKTRISEPKVVLEATASELEGFWKPTGGDENPLEKAMQAATEQGVKQVEPAEPDQIVTASRSFDISTALSVDGLHPVHLGMLSLQVLLALRLLFAFIEEIGQFPLQISRLLFVLLDKPKGGKRLIALFCWLFRLWSPVRKRHPEVEVWQRRCDRPFYAMGKGRSLETIVWRQAVRAETALSQQNVEAGTALWDAKN